MIPLVNSPHGAAHPAQRAGYGLLSQAARSAEACLPGGLAFAAIISDLSPLQSASPSILVAALLLSAGAALAAFVYRRLTQGVAEPGLPAFAALLLAIAALVLLAAGAAPWRLVPGALLLGAAMACYALPGLDAARAPAVQESTQESRASHALIGALTLGLALVYLAAGAATGLGLVAFGLPVAWVLALAAVTSVGLAAVAYGRDPQNALRFLAALLMAIGYRINKQGFEHIPASGPALLVCNHVSFVDSVLLFAAVRRPVRFVMDHAIYRAPGIGFVFRHVRTIPIAPAKEDPALKEAAFEAVAKALRDGEVIGLFPEGRITRTGELDTFRYGVGRMVSETPVPVIPIALRGLWGSFFSRRYGRAMTKPSLLRPRAPIDVVVGPPVPPQAVSPEYLQTLVAGLLHGAG